METKEALIRDPITAGFYGEFWPKYVQYYNKTKAYMVRTLSDRRYRHALDAGCGPGICSLVLSEVADKVLAVDISDICIRTAQEQAIKAGRMNIEFAVRDLQLMSSPRGEFDLVWCWGVAMMAPDPKAVISNLFSMTAPGGEVYLGLYLKTWLSPVHQVVRHFCRRFMNTPKKKEFVLSFFSFLTWILGGIKRINLRDDNVSVKAQVDDWYYPPYKTFYSIKEALAMFREAGFGAECIQDRVGRMRSATIFIIRGSRVSSAASAAAPAA